MQLTLPYTFVDGTVAYGSHVNANNSAIATVLNGAIEDDNIANASITASSKLVASSIQAAQIATGQIRADHMDWEQGNLGVRAWRQLNYAGASGSRLIRIEKTIALAAAVTEQSFTIDWSAGDCPDGTTTFSAAPTITGLTILDPAGGQIRAVDPDAIAYIKVGTRSTTSCTVLITFSNAPTAGNVVLMALVAGGVS